MRCILLVPAADPAALDAARFAGADAVVVDLAGAPDRIAARAAAAEFLRRAAGPRDHPHLYVGVGAIDSGDIDDDLAATLAGPADGVLLPGARGGGDLVHLGAKLAVQEALHGRPDGATKILAQATDDAAALFGLGTYARASGRLAGLIFRCDGLPGERGSVTHRLARALCLAGAAAAEVPAFDGPCDGPDGAGLAAEIEAACCDGFAGKLTRHAHHVAAIRSAFG